MKNLKPLLLTLILILSSCYVYRPYSGEEEVVENTTSRRGGLASPSSIRGVQRSTSEVSIGTIRRDAVDPDKENAIEESKKIEENKRIDEELKGSGQVGTIQTASKKQEEFEAEEAEKEKARKIELEGSDELTLKEMLKPNRHYKLTVEEKRYKVQVDKWEGDTLISHVIRKPERVLKFHENQIDQEEVLERRFSKPISDMITIGSYIAVGATALLLLL